VLTSVRGPALAMLERGGLAPDGIRIEPSLDAAADYAGTYASTAARTVG